MANALVGLQCRAASFEFFQERKTFTPFENCRLFCILNIPTLMGECFVCVLGTESTRDTNYDKTRDSKFHLIDSHCSSCAR